MKRLRYFEDYNNPFNPEERWDSEDYSVDFGEYQHLEEYTIDNLSELSTTKYPGAIATPELNNTEIKNFIKNYFDGKIYVGKGNKGTVFEIRAKTTEPINKTQLKNDIIKNNFKSNVVSYFDTPHEQPSFNEILMKDDYDLMEIIPQLFGHLLKKTGLNIEYENCLWDDRGMNVFEIIR